MGKSNYVLHCELNEALAESEDTLRKCIGENRKAVIALGSLLVNLEKKRKLIESERHQAWERYAEAYKDWLMRHKDNLTSMEAGMTEPNKPSYEFANND